MKICIIDKNLNENMAKKLENLGFFLIKTRKLEGINGPLSTHPDIQLCKVSEDTLVVEPSVFDYYEKNLSKYGIIIKSGFSKVRDPYPKDAAYNCAINKDYSFHNFEITDEILKENLSKNKIHLKQGYSKCNILLTKSGLITSDMGIYKKTPSRKLLISKGHVELEGYDYGFIGGASGCFDKVYFLGDVTLHPDFEQIRDFLAEENTEFEILGRDKLHDYGSLIFIGKEEER